MPADDQVIEDPDFDEAKRIAQPMGDQFVGLVGSATPEGWL